MYRGYEVLARAAFRVTRNSNLYFEEEEARSLLETIRVELHNRRKGDAVRLEIETGADPEIVERLRVNFELDEDQVFRGDGPVNLSRLMFFYGDVQRPDLKFQPFTPKPLHLSRKSTNIFDELRHHDILLHHPYDSYDPVVDFIQQGADDPAVVTMKQTLYRTSHDSPMFQALTEAAATKEATLVVELMARFDEASNIRWARSMEDAGVQVFHGVVGLKTHCKLAMLVRRDEDGVTRRYCHLGTGNYNPVTARFYTDLSLLTCDPQITERVHMVFNYLTAHAEVDDYRPLLVAPLTMAESFLGLIRREQEHAQAGRPAHIVAKMNALLEPSVIEALYQASQAGVEIDLIIRGLCILRPGVKGLSDRIRVRSIVGRFLEHSRIFHFANGGDDEIYIGSADWMPRNLFERCEVVFPVRDAAARARIHDEILPAYLADTVKARLQQPDGTYLRASKALRDAPRLLCAGIPHEPRRRQSRCKLASSNQAPHSARQAAKESSRRARPRRRLTSPDFAFLNSQTAAPLVHPTKTCWLHRSMPSPASCDSRAHRREPISYCDPMQSGLPCHARGTPRAIPQNHLDQEKNSHEAHSYSRLLHPRRLPSRTRPEETSRR